MSKYAKLLQKQQEQEKQNEAEIKAQEEERHKGIKEVASCKEHKTEIRQIKDLEVGRYTYLVPLTDLYEAKKDWNFFSKAKAPEMDKMKWSLKNDKLVQPICVWRKPSKKGEYMILAGHTRYQATKELHEETGEEQYARIEVLVYDNLSEVEAQRLIITTNFNSRTLSPYEKLKSIVQLYDKVKPMGKSQDFVAKELGCSKKTVENYLKLRHLIPKLFELFETGHLTVRAGICVARLSEDLQIYISKNYKNKLQNPIVKQDYLKRLENLVSTITTEEEIDLVLQPPLSPTVEMKSIKVKVPDYLEARVLKAIQDLISANSKEAS